MSAYDHLLVHSSQEVFAGYRQILVNSRGTLSNGNFVTGMDAQYDKNQTAQMAQSSLIPGEEKKPITPLKIYIRVGAAQQPGFIFDKNGTTEAISVITTGGELKLNDLGELLAFNREVDRDNWLVADKTLRRRCLAMNVLDMYKKTDVIYRTNGDRLHYFVNGLITIKDHRGETNKYPLFLFSCTDLNKSTLSANIEQGGFINFWLDKNVLENNIAKANGGSIEISMASDYSSRCNAIATQLTKLQLAEIESISVDPSYSALTIVTGFEAEYIDPVWEKILEGVKL